MNHILFCSASLLCEHQGEADVIRCAKSAMHHSSQEFAEFQGWIEDVGKGGV